MSSEKAEKEVIQSTEATELEQHHADQREEPTEEDYKTLREVPDSIPIAAYFVVLVEFCERFTYYGLIGPFQNYIQFPAPESYPADQPGAMGRGQQTATALTTFFQFWCYVTPIIGGIVADQYLGKYRAILLFGTIYMLGLIIITATSAPSSLETAALPGFVVSILIIGLGTGGIKANVSTLVAEQYQNKTPFVRTLKNGERVLVTPQATYQRIFSTFYWSINIGGMSAIATTTMEKNIGFWAAYLLPTCMFIPCLAIVILGRKKYVEVPPRGSVVLEAIKCIYYNAEINGPFSGLDKLDAVKPSQLAQTHPKWAAGATWDDTFVDELRRCLRACIVFCWYPIFWLCYVQMTNNLISQAATMLTGNIPNDIINNIDPFFVICFIPVMDRIIYPLLRRFGYPMRPITRIALGFFFGGLAMAYSAGIQVKIYETPPFYKYPGTNEGRNWISAAYQIPAYIFIAMSEIFASITGLEYAYKKAPQSMKSVVMSIFLFMNCIASLIGFALVPVAKDPTLPWMYTGIGVAAFICSILLYICHRGQDKTDIQDDAIGRSIDEIRTYGKKQADKTDDDDVEKSAA
ncbi:peptide transporter PTR2-A [Dichotomocladium elegans]|nr:peptide transporter PTR2-A [Dichotomocladium elegans]